MQDIFIPVQYTLISMTWTSRGWCAVIQFYKLSHWVNNGGVFTEKFSLLTQEEHRKTPIIAFHLFSESTYLLLFFSFLIGFWFVYPMRIRQV